MKNYCIDCNKSISRNSIRCKSCENLNRTIYKEPNKCIDCGKIILKNSKRCYKCHNSGKNARKYIDGRTLKEYFCEVCGKKISSYRHKRCPICSVRGRKLSKEHCEKIRVNAKIRLSIPENNPNWQNGISFEEYPREFNSELKEQIRKRDDYICQCCGMTEEEHIIVYGEVLNIHHIDYDKMNCIKNNLITTCRNCNIRANYNREYWSKYFKGENKHVANQQP